MTVHADADALPPTTETFRSVFRHHAAGVAVVTAQGGRPAGFTATSLSSVAVAPPTVSFAMSTSSSSWPVFRDASHVGVHILAADQRDLASRFATAAGPDRFAAPTRWRRGPYDVPVLDGVLAWLVCRVEVAVPAGDHRLIVARAVAAESRSGGRPLLYHDRAYVRLCDG
ncbi:flavin reductase family protein [Streptomyces corynorhini]|uniref:Flavin reductase n=1 Tax=Streptomyces corynorhini TaxID=2282652 RepID=A0A370BAF4_9ACTN|nr:flavin reductase family protein [Streptomyces corynorhini]RDG36793.1 flavin reductase [Streptomyces corynorhini]